MSESVWAIERRGLRRLAWVADYAALTKPRITAMVLIVVAVAAFVGGGGDCTGWTLVHALLGTLLVAASASATNQWLERRCDGLMERTANRPLPAGRLNFAAGDGILPGDARSRHVVSPGVGQCSGRLLGLGDVAAVRVDLHADETADGSEHGGGSRFGALPVFIGWSTSGGGWNVTVQPGGVALFLVLFLWQFPHFMAIAWIYRHQYARAGLRMMTVVEPTGRWAGWHAVAAAGLLLPVSWFPAYTATWQESILYLTVASALGLAQLDRAVRFLRVRNDRTARALLRITLLYLPVLLIALVLHSL